MLREKINNLLDRLSGTKRREQRERDRERELKRLRRALGRAKKELRWQSEVSAALAALYKPLISADSSIEEMANTVLEQARRLTGSAHGYVSSIDSGSRESVIHTITAMGGKTGERAAVSRDENGNYLGLRGHALNTGKAFFTNRPNSHPKFMGLPEGHAVVERFLSVPVLLGGKPAGQITLANPPTDYTERDMAAIGRLAGFYALALQRKESQETTVAALREKEILLREIHHRVKNNLQVISSLLNLQARCLDDRRAVEILKESQNRVHSMAMVHEQLHRSRDLSKINFGDYVRTLVAGLFSSYGMTSSTVTPRILIGDAAFPIDTAIPCGLIIQELVSNSLKHAFPGGRQGEIRIALRRVREEQWQLTVADDGAGLPVEEQKRESSSLGLRLVGILANQLEAAVECVSSRGTEFRITFPAFGQ